MIEIRQACGEDAEAIHRIARQLALEGRDLNAARATGFFLYVGAVEDYRKTVTDSPCCFVAMSGSECTGFLTTVTPESMAAIPSRSNRALFESSGEFPFLIEQIGVSPEWQGRGIGQALLEALLAATGSHRLMATIIHSPVRNERSIRFLTEKNGWTLVREVTTPTRVWGFYEYRR